MTDSIFSKFQVLRDYGDIFKKLNLATIKEGVNKLKLISFDVGIIKIPKYITHRTPGIFLEVGMFSLHLKILISFKWLGGGRHGTNFEMHVFRLYHMYGA